MPVFYKKHLVAFALLFIVVLFQMFACSSDKQKKDREEVSDNEQIEVDSTFVNKAEADIERIAYVKNKALIFFRIGSTEYQNLLNQSDDVAAFDFQLLFKRFDRLSKEFSRAISSNGIDSDLLYEKKIIFVMDSGEYVFDRIKTDMIMGQILFNGHDSLVIEEGYVEPQDLSTYIKDFFKTDSILVNSHNIQLPIDTIYQQDSTSTQAKDTLSRQDTIVSGTQIESN